MDLCRLWSLLKTEKSVNIFNDLLPDAKDRDLRCPDNAAVQFELDISPAVKVKTALRERI